MSKYKNKTAAGFGAVLVEMLIEILLSHHKKQNFKNEKSTQHGAQHKKK